MMTEIFGLLGLLIFGLFLLFWGGRMVLSDKFFTYWQNTHWKERNNAQWSPKSVDYNRYGTALGSAVAGAAIVVAVIYAFFKI